MSGIEGAAIAGGGRLLGALAAPAARALVRKVLFRQRVARRVRKTSEFSCNWRAYRGWLKTLTLVELSAPVEDVSATLAVRLDDRLSRASDRWSSAHDHLSRALCLVEMTYPAIAAELDDPDRVERSEAWAQQRSFRVRELLLQLAGPGAALGSADLAAVLQQRSAARRAVRLQAFDLDEVSLQTYFDRITGPDVPEGQVVVVVGDFGSGKSEVAEAWHRAAVAELGQSDDAPLPVWLRARDMVGQAIEAAVDGHVGPIWRRGRGASIVLDGLDEADAAAAQAILEDARILSRSHLRVRVLLTARPGILSPADHDEEKVVVPLLSEEEALELVELAGGNARATWQWTAGMRTTVRRPFFALAAGLALGGKQAPAGEADLIRTLVENSLERGAERSAVTSTQTRMVLTNLAICLTRSGKDQISFSDRQMARSSRLVADGPKGGVIFSLPIFQHWFAAQAILEGTISPMDVVADAASFNRWRWAAAVAALSAPTPHAVDELLGAWVTGNPGAAGWIIKEAFNSDRTWRTKDDGALDPTTSRARLLTAMRTWTDALGPLADGVLPPHGIDGPIDVKVAVQGHQYGVWSPATDDDATSFPSPVLASSRGAVRGPRWGFGGGVPEGDAWPWTLIRDRIAKQMIGKLTDDPNLGAPDGIWRQERRFEISRHLLRRGFMSRDDLAADEVRSESVKLLERAASNSKSRFSFGGRTVAGTELQDLVNWIDSTGATEVKSHLPQGDVAHPPSGEVWDFYSTDRLMAFEAEVYGRACQAYDEALTHAFGRFGWSMPRSALQPVGVILELSYNEAGAHGGRFPVLTIVPVPMPLIQQLTPSGPDVVWSTSGRASIRQITYDHDDHERYRAILKTIASWLAEHDRGPGVLGWTHSIIDNMSDARPSSSVAANWLSDDLKKLGLGGGNLSLR